MSGVDFIIAVGARGTSGNICLQCIARNNWDLENLFYYIAINYIDALNARLQ